MMKEVLLGLLSVATIVGVIAFLIRQGIWTRYIQPLVSRKPKLTIRFEDGQDVIHLGKSNPEDLDKAVSDLMAKELQVHPYQHYTEPSFQNPFPQLFEGDSTNKKIYNNHLDDYLKEKEAEYRNIERGKIEDDFMQSVKLVLRNDGEVGSGKLNIHLKVEPNSHVYLVGSREAKRGDTIEPPMCMPDGIFPLLDYKRLPYTYTLWDLASHLTGEIQLSVDFLNHHSKDDNCLPVLYVDTRYEQKVSIRAKVIDSSVLEPFETETIIIVE